MSHPPETSLSSRELAERIWVCADDRSLADDYPERWKEKAAALIDAWVREREAQARRDQHQSEHGCENTTRGAWEGCNCRILANLESALSTARKQLEEKT